MFCALCLASRTLEKQYCRRPSINLLFLNRFPFRSDKMVLTELNRRHKTTYEFRSFPKQLIKTFTQTLCESIQLCSDLMKIGVTTIYFHSKSTVWDIYGFVSVDMAFKKKDYSSSLPFSMVYYTTRQSYSIVRNVIFIRKSCAEMCHLLGGKKYGDFYNLHLPGIDCFLIFSLQRTKKEMRKEMESNVNVNTTGTFANRWKKMFYLRI